MAVLKAKKAPDLAWAELMGVLELYMKYVQSYLALYVGLTSALNTICLMRQ